MEKEEKLKKKRYEKAMSAHHKELVRLAKRAAPWEYGDILAIMLEYFKMARDYYDIKYNVWGEEADDNPEHNRFNISNALVNEYEASLDLPVLEKEAIALGLGVDRAEIYRKCTDIDKLFEKDDEGNCIWHDPLTEKEYSYLNAVDIAEEAHYNNFIEIFKTKLRFLWD